MAKNTVKFELFYDGTWHDLVTSGKVFAEDITITRGSGSGEVGGFRPTSITARLNNDDDMLRPGNPESPLYGKVGRGVPVRVTVNGSVRGYAQITSLSAGQTNDFRMSPPRGKSWIDLVADGTLYRVNSWGKTMRSPFYRHNMRIPNVVGYWPLEDASGTLYPATPTVGATSGLNRNLAFGSQYRPAGSDPVADLDSAPTSTEGFFRPGNEISTTGWQISWAQKFTDFDPAETYTFIFWNAGMFDWVFLYSSGQFVLIGNKKGQLTPVVNKVVSTSINLADCGWMLWNVEAKHSAGTTTVEVIGWSENTKNFEATFSDTYTGITSSLTDWAFSGISQTDMSVGHVLGLNVPKATVDLLGQDRRNDFIGRPNERATDRFYRILNNEEGVGVYTFGGSNSRIMAEQHSGTFGEVLTEIANTDDAIVVDHRTERNINIIGRTARYNQTPFTIDVSELPFPPPDATDDVGIWNVSSLQTPDGQEYQGRQDTGPMSTQDPPNGIGERIQPSIAVNPISGIEQDVNWWLRRGTVELPRYPKVTINLSALDPVRAGQIAEIDVSSVVEITGYRENPIRLHVLSTSEVVDWPNGRLFVLTCAPDQQFDVGTYGTSSTQRRYDMKTATIKVAATSTATQLILKQTDDETWSNTSTYDVMIAGERITFQAGQMGARTGSAGNYQQIVQNVLRSRNGIVKPLPVGAEIHVYEQGRWAL